MISGARRGKPTWLHRLVAMGLARDLRALVIPGLEVAHARGMDPGAAGLRMVATPRHANILLLVGPISLELGTAAAVLYAQMMRPRAIFALGCDEFAALPKADLSAAPTQHDLLNGVAQLRKLLAQSAFQSDPPDFNAPILETRIEYTCPMHPDIVQDGPGSCPKCGMTLRPHESVSSGNSAHDNMDMNHADRDHGTMGFMSMVEVTKDLPRSRDGLPMDWIEVPFGPVFPGLPGGLLLTLTLDGDVIAQANAQSLVGGAESLPATGMEATRFVEYLGAIDPLTPVAYRLLACRALEAATERPPDQSVLRGRVVALERERIASHLGWLAMLGRQIGFVWLERHAARMQLECLRADLPGIMCLRPAVDALAGRLARTPLLYSRLSGIGPVAPDPGLRGPVARAAGMWCDARTTDETYNALSFQVMRQKNGNALDRLHIRLEEMRQSLALIQLAGVLKEPAFIDSGAATGEGQATVETSRGEARLNVIMDSGRVIRMHLDTPSTFQMSLLPHLLVQQELGDALTSICTLDLSPWGIVA